jgi:acyl carrier protein
MGRSEPSAVTQSILETLGRMEARVVVAQGDVAEQEQVARVLANIEQTMPPLRGVVHAAGILDDGILLQQNQERLQSVMAPKVKGAWNLHTLTLDRALDFFVLFSSVAAFLGPPGQGNYAAANAFLDGLAKQRRLQGRPTLSINWGPWAEIGLSAAQSKQSKRHAYQGLRHITRTQGIEVLQHLLYQDICQIAVMPFSVQQWCQLYPSAAASRLYASLLQGESLNASLVSGEAGNMRSELLALKSGRERRSVLESHLQAECAQVLKLALSRIDLHTSLQTMGLDSLMGLELRNRLEAGLGLKLPATLIWNYPTIAALVPHLADIMDLPLEETVSVQSALGDDDMPSAATIEMESYSQDKINAMLAEELEAIDQLLRGKEDA